MNEALKNTRIVLCEPSHAGNIGAAARAMLTRVPLTEAQAADPALQRQFARELEGAPRTWPRPIEVEWRNASIAQRRETEALLTRLEAA